MELAVFVVLCAATFWLWRIAYLLECVLKALEKLARAPKVAPGQGDDVASGRD